MNIDSAACKERRHQRANAQRTAKSTTTITLSAVLASLVGLAVLLVGLNAMAQVNSDRVATGLIALYPFDENSGTTATDRSGYGSPMNLQLTGAASWNTTGNGVVLSGGRVGTSGAAGKVIDALRSSNTSSFELWLTPGNINQGGPARLISIAADVYERNYLLGQERDEVQIRLRHTGKDGDKPHLITSNGPLRTKLMHVVHTYDGAVERLYIDGVLQSAQVVRGGAYSNWYTGHKLSIGNETSSDRPFAGTVHLAAIYNRALIPEEVQQNYSAGAASSGALDTTPPSIPGSLTATLTGANQVELSWSEATDDTGIQSYKIYRNGVFIAETTDQTRYIDAGTSADTTYEYAVRALDTSGNKSGYAKVTISVPSPFASRVGSGLVAFYPFNEGSGSSATDQSGFGIPMNLTLSGAVSWNAAGNGVVMSGGRVGTSGKASKLINALRSSNASSFEIWMQPANTSQGGPARLLALAADPYQRNYLLGQDRGKVHVRLLHTGKESDKPHLITANSPLTNRLIHIVHTYDGVVERLYIDGVLQSAEVALAGDYSNWYANHLFSIGNEASGDRPFSGLIQMVAIYDRAINEGEIQQNYEAGAGSSQGGGGSSGGSGGSGGGSGGDSGSGGSDSGGSGSGSGGSDSGTIKLSWQVPTTRSSGERMSVSDLDSYYIFAQATGSSATLIYLVDDPSQTSFVVSGVAPGQYELAMVAVDKNGASSTPSNKVSVTVN